MKKRFSKRAVIVGLLVFLLLSGSVGALLYKQQQNSDNDSAEIAESEAANEEVPGATDAEKQDSDQHKDDLVDRQKVENTEPTASQKQVTPVLANASQNGQEVFVSGFVPGVFENGGICTFTFSKGSTQFSKTSEAFANVSTTDCKNLSINRSEFSSSGEWSVTLSYKSTTATGVSPARKFNLQ